MGTTEWTIIATAVALFVALGSLIRFSNAGVKNDIANLRTDLNGDIANLRTDLNGDIANLRTEIADLRGELKEDIANVRTEIADLRTELKLDVQSNRAEIITNRRMLGRFALHRHGDDGLPIAPLTDALEPPDGSGESLGTENGNA